ncbi:UNVERIFIED_CONTAM: hypothetical protein K2H54_016462 [Gekko kuhli]
MLAGGTTSIAWTPLCGVCGAHGRGGRATLPFPKEAVALKVKEIMMDSFFSIEPKFLLAMRAVGELSKFQPPISWDLRASMVAWALGLVLGGSPADHEEAGGQGLRQEREEGLHPMLLALLREDPSAGNFFTLLDVIAWERCRRDAERKGPPPPTANHLLDVSEVACPQSQGIRPNGFHPPGDLQAALLQQEAKGGLQVLLQELLREDLSAGSLAGLLDLSMWKRVENGTEGAAALAAMAVPSARYQHRQIPAPLPSRHVHRQGCSLCPCSHTKAGNSWAAGAWEGFLSRSKAKDKHLLIADYPPVPSLLRIKEMVETLGIVQGVHLEGEKRIRRGVGHRPK